MVLIRSSFRKAYIKEGPQKILVIFSIMSLLIWKVAAIYEKGMKPLFLIYLLSSYVIVY